MIKRLWTDRRIETIIAFLLLCGVVIAALVVVTGGTLFLFRHGLDHPDYRVFHGEPAALRNVRGIMTEAMAFHGRGLIELGILLLIATPVARVGFSIFGFMREGDRTYVIVTLIVLCFLLFSLCGGVK